MDVSSVSAGAQSVSGSVFKGAMETTANSVLKLLEGMPAVSPAPPSGMMDIRV